MKIYYQNSSGKTLNLMAWPIMIQEPETLFGHEWQYSSNEGVYGATITDFTLGVAQKTAALSIFADTADEFAATFNEVHSIFEYDILHNTSGKLYINDQYLPCYCFSAEYQEFEEYFESTDVTLRFVSGYPFWCQDMTTSFHKASGNGTGNTFLDYPKRYKYDYTYNRTVESLINEHYAACDFQMIVYGSCTNPQVYIDNHLYEVLTEIPAGGYMVIDSRFNTVKKYDSYGTETSVFNSRNKESGLFKKIPAGTNAVSWSAGFGFDITLFYERSTPKWISS